VHDGHLVPHARTGVDQHDEIDRDLARLEEPHLLLHAVLVDRKIVLGQPGDVLLLRIHDRDVQRDEVGGAAKHRLLLGSSVRLLGSQGDAEGGGQRRAENEALQGNLPSLRRSAAVQSPFRPQPDEIIR
jgi:hypothetical protein